MEQKKKRDPRVFLGLMMGGGSLAAGLIKFNLFDGAIDWFFWSLAGLFVIGMGVCIWYIGMRRFHSETRTFIDRPPRKPAPSHHDESDKH